MINPASSESDSDHGFQIAPMVDVVFVLLLFFMALAGLRQIETQTKVELPNPGDRVLRELPLVIDIAANGEVRCNGLELIGANETETARMISWLKDVANADKNTPVIIRPAGQAEHGRFIQVLASIQQAGLKKISFA